MESPNIFQTGNMMAPNGTFCVFHFGSPRPSGTQHLLGYSRPDGLYREDRFIGVNQLDLHSCLPGFFFHGAFAVMRRASPGLGLIGASSMATN